MSRTLCRRCERPVSECYCEALVAVANSLPVLILQHPSEAKHPYNTARIARLCLERCRIVECETIPKELAREVEAASSVLVFPELPWLEEAQPAPSVPGLLVLLDGTWNKAKKILHANPWLQRLPRLAIEPKVPSAYAIRKSRFPDGLSTIESAVVALDLLDGGRSHEALLAPFRRMVALAQRYDPSGPR